MGVSHIRESAVNLILEKTTQVRYFTNMQLVFQALEMSAADYDWYISDIETNYITDHFSSSDQWIPGETLKYFLDHNDIQFIWAVFSAVPKGFRIDVHDAPYVEDNPVYWNGTDIKPQLKGALFEIACWDSSATILVGLPPEAEAAFIRTYSDTRPLESAAR